MSDSSRVIHCKLVDCYSYRNYPDNAPQPSSSGLCNCVHPNSDMIIEYEPCRFYRMDWSKKLKQMKKPMPGKGPK